MGKRPEVPFYMEWPVSPSDRGSLVTILRPVGQNKDQYKPKYHFQLGEREYSAIGFATVHWAFLEEALYKRTVLFARRARVRVPEDAHDLSFSRRIGALRVLVRTAVKDPKRRKWWSLVISRIGNENGIRQKIVHGSWSYDPRRPDRLFSSPRPSIGRWMEPFSDEKLSEFGQRAQSFPSSFSIRSLGRVPAPQSIGTETLHTRVDRSG